LLHLLIVNILRIEEPELVEVVFVPVAVEVLADEPRPLVLLVPVDVNWLLVESLCKGYPDEADFVSLSEVEVLE
jgi:hypothetical protein